MANPVVSLLRSKAAGAAVAQVWQAVGSFGLQDLVEDVLASFFLLSVEVSALELRH